MRLNQILNVLIILMAAAIIGHVLYSWLGFSESRAGLVTSSSRAQFQPIKEIKPPKADKIKTTDKQLDGDSAPAAMVDALKKAFPSEEVVVKSAKQNKDAYKLKLKIGDTKATAKLTLENGAVKGTVQKQGGAKVEIAFK